MEWKDDVNGGEGLGNVFLLVGGILVSQRCRCAISQVSQFRVSKSSRHFKGTAFFFSLCSIFFFLFSFERKVQHDRFVSYQSVTHIVYDSKHLPHYVSISYTSSSSIGRGYSSSSIAFISIVISYHPPPPNWALLGPKLRKPNCS